MRWKALALLLAVALGFLLGRRTLSELVEPFVPDATPHEAYGRALAESSLAEAAMVRLWNRAARHALAEAPRVDTPFREDGYLDPSRPAAVAYRFRAATGQRLALSVTLEPRASALLFLDLFRVEAEGEPVHVASADSGALVLEHEPGRSGDYIVRVQPELLRGGRYVLRGAVLPTMAFPVAGRGGDAVGSVFGDPRDGGRRDHHGIDIFAPRGTPVVATVAGRVSRVRTTPIGGRVVWLRDAGEDGRDGRGGDDRRDGRSQSIYYAHLETQLVAEGAWVEPGDTLGLVGNSGNARNTPPHLHFGIYRRGRGPVDPLPFVEPRPVAAPAPAPAAVAELGGWRRVATAAALRASPAPASPVVDRLAPDVPVRAHAVIGDWLRVELPDGRRGFLAARSTESARPLRTAVVAAAGPLRDRPAEAGVEVSRLERGAEVEVLGRFRDHLYVRAGRRLAWLPITAPDGPRLDNRGIFGGR